MDAKLNPFPSPAPLHLAWSASTSTLPRRARLFMSKTGWLRRWAARVRRALSRAGGDELRGMSDHDLKDLGIGRSEIPHILGRGADLRSRYPS